MITLSTAEAEYIATGNYATHVVWLRRILGELQNQQNKSTMIFCDNKSRDVWSKNLVFYSRSKHIEIKYHYIRKKVQHKKIEFKFCSSKNQVANIFTNSLQNDVFLKFKRIMELVKFKNLV